MSDQRELPGESAPQDDLFPEQEVDVVEPRTPVTVRGVAIVSARVMTGLIGIGVAAATIAASALLPLPGIHAVPPSTVITPVPTAQQLVCPGAVVRLSDETGRGATTVSAIGKPDTDYRSSAGSIDATPLTSSDASTGGSASAPIVVSTPPDPGAAAQLLLSGAQSQSVKANDFVGLAAADCGVANGDSWLAGGATTVGRTTLLTLSNPTEVAATANIVLYGETGLIAAPGTSGIIVPARGQRVLSLAGFRPNIVSPIVHVSSSGGQVVANLQESIIRGLDAGGVDIIGPTSAPAASNVIPGLLVANSAAVQALLGRGADYNDVVPVLRLFAPGTGTVSTTINVIPEDATAAGTSFTYQLEAGRVVDVPFSDLGDGNYTVKVITPVPVIAAVRVSTAVVGGSTDFTWLSAASELDDHAQLTVARGPSPQLHLANTTTGATTVTLTAQDGTVTKVALPAGSSALAAVRSGVTYQLTGFDSIYAAVTVIAPGLIARYAVHPPGEGSTPVTVYR